MANKIIVNGVSEEYLNSQFNRKDITGQTTLDDLTSYTQWSTIRRIMRKKLIMLATNVFEYEGFPAYMPTFMIEYWLLVYGKVAFYLDRDDEGLFVYRCLPCTSTNLFNIYREYKEVRVISINGKVHKNLKQDQFVMCYDNTYSFTEDDNLLDIINYYADKLTDIVLTKDSNLLVHRKPMLFKGTKESEKSEDALYKQYKNNSPYIKLTQELSDSVDWGFKSESIPYIIGELSTEFKYMFNEAVNSIGIDVVDIEKNERLTQAESISSRNISQLIFESRNQTRQLFTTRLYEMFGFTGTIKRRENIGTIYNNIAQLGNMV